MGQSWWWVVLAVVVVVALLVVMALLRSRRQRADVAPGNVEVAVAAAGGAAGAAGVVAADHAEEEESAPVDESALDEPDEPTTDSTGTEAVSEPGVTEAGVADAGASDGSAATDAAPAADSSAPAETGDSQPSELVDDLPEPRAAGRLDTSSPEDDGPATAPAGAAASIPAPREEQPLSESSAEPAEHRTPAPRTSGPAGSALSAIDSGLVGPATSVAAAAAAVSAATSRPGPYPGSLLPAEDGSSPSPDHQVKANEGSRRFHTPDSPFYLRTRGDAWFRTTDEARAAGFTAWDA